MISITIFFVYYRLENLDNLEQLQKVKAESEILKSQLSKSTADIDYDAQDTMRNLDLSEDAFSSARTIPKSDYPDLLTVRLLMIKKILKCLIFIIFSIQ